MKSNIILSFIVLLFYYRYVQCYEIPGQTLPPTVEIEVGGSANISCYMNPRSFPNKSSKDMYFINAYTKQIVPRSDIVILNSTAIVYMLRNAREQYTLFSCHCGELGIMDTKVYVGYKPQEIQDFNCRAYDFTSMVCSFTKPENPVLTQYNLSFYLTPHYKNLLSCNYTKAPLITCAVKHYQPLMEIYHYELISKNPLGINIQNFYINNTKVMVLAKPGQDFINEEITTNSALFSFKIKNLDMYSSKLLQWDVEVKPANLTLIDLSQISITRPQNKGNRFELRLKNLKYAHYLYDIQLRVRLHGTNAWSDPFTHTFRTKARHPDRPPQVDVGCFYIDSSEQHIRLYWKLLEFHEQNGDNFTYHITVHQNGKILPMTPVLMESNSALFLWEKEKEYMFEIRSQNEKGLSENASVIYIPAMGRLTNSQDYTPTTVQDVYHDTNRSYTITWETPYMSSNLTDYTVFWCRTKQILLNRCEGSINYIHVHRDARKFTTSAQEHPLKLAVSANYNGFNTGMHWTDCTMNEENDLVQMKPVVEVKSSSTIKVQWSSEMICPSIFDNYNLSYCELAETELSGNSSDNCIFTENSQSSQYVIVDKNVNRFELTNLKPYTRYKIEMLMYSSRKNGKTSEPKILRTAEFSSTPPRHLNVTRITNTSAILSWLPPSQRNGILRSYNIVLNDKEIEIPIEPNNISEDPFLYELKNLSSYTMYKVYVIAKTVSNSEPSNDVHFKTLVGYPSVPGALSKIGNNNEITIEWVIPDHRVDYYEVMVTVTENVTTSSRRISIVKGVNSCVLNLPKCLHSEQVTTVHVRAVNAALLSTDVIDVDDVPDLVKDIDEDFNVNEDELTCVSNSALNDKEIAMYKDSSVYRLYKSKWQSGLMFGCPAVKVGVILKYISGFLLLGFGLLMALFVMRRKYQKMADIKCTLPSGLTACSVKDFSGLNVVYPNDLTTSLKNDATNINTQTENLTPSDNVFNHGNIPDYMLHNEEHCLLETTSNDSIFAEDQTQSSNYDQQEIGETEIELHTDLERKRELNDSIVTAENTNIQSMSPYYVQRIKPIHQSLQPNNFNITDYTAVENIASNTGKLPSYNLVQNTGLYVQPDAFNAIRPIPNVPQQNPILRPNIETTSSPSGYTTLDQLSKMPRLQSTAGNWETTSNNANVNENLPPNLQNNISGYITQRELTVFGQQQQQQQPQQNTMY